jgi:hypothetical protein
MVRQAEVTGLARGGTTTDLKSNQARGNELDCPAGCRELNLCRADMVQKLRWAVTCGLAGFRLRLGSLADARCGWRST